MTSLNSTEEEYISYLNKIKLEILKFLDFEFFIWKYNESYLLQEKILISDFKERKEKLSVPLFNIFNSIAKEKGVKFNKIIENLESDSVSENKISTKWIDSYMNNAFQKNWNSKNKENEIFKNLKFECNKDGNFVTFVIKEEKEIDEKYSNFFERSDGFKRMASIIFCLNNNVKNRIFLIDEIETHIHIDGQIKLQELLTKISKENQIIYSIISPFMIQNNNEANYLIFEKNKNHETNITTKQGNLDHSFATKIYEIDIYEHFLSPSTIIIFEGESDQKFFEKILSRANFNFSNIRFYAANVASKMKYDLKYFMNRRAKKIYLIFDNDKEGKAHKRKLNDYLNLKEDKDKEGKSDVFIFSLDEIVNNKEIELLEHLMNISNEETKKSKEKENKVNNFLNDLEDNFLELDKHKNLKSMVEWFKKKFN